MFKISGVINYLLVAFLNAFTDLGHKIIIQNTVFKVYDSSEQIILSAVVNALMLLPFILVFTPAGYIATRFAKTAIMKYSALFAIAITTFITICYYNGWFEVAFAMTFLMALQSALYSPAKYGYIKELVGTRYISAGNGALQGVTTAAILLGIVFYTYLFEGIVGDSFNSKEEIIKAIAPLGWLLVLGSVIEYVLASKLEDVSLKKYDKKFSFVRYGKGVYLRKNIVMLKRKKEIFDSIIALSLFWSISQVILAIFGEYVKSELNITNAMFVQGTMGLSVVGIIVGSLLCAKFSAYYVNSGFSALGSLGIVVMLFLIPFTTSTYLLSTEFVLFGLFSGFVIVPLSSKIQELSSNIHLGTILAGNNFVQTIFMFSFLFLTTLFAYFGANAKILFFIMGFVGIYLSYILFKRYLVISFWALCEMIFSLRYRFSYVGLENIPQDSAVLLVGNHISWIDWFVLQLPIERRIGFLIDKDIYNKKLLKPIFKLGSLIPISQRASKDSFIETSKRLKNGKIVAIFPEGEIARQKELGEFRSGYKYIHKEGIVIVPFFIYGIFGSIFSRHKDESRRSFFKKREITTYFGEPILREIDSSELKEIVKNLKRN